MEREAVSLPKPIAMIISRSVILIAVSAFLIGSNTISAQSAHGGLKLISNNKIVYEDRDILKLCADLAYGTNKEQYSQLLIEGIKADILNKTGQVVIKELTKLNSITYMQLVKRENHMLVRYLVPGNTCRFWISKTKSPLLPWLSDITFEIEWDMLIEMQSGPIINLADLQLKNAKLYADINCRILYMNGRRKDEDAMIIDHVTTWALKDKGILKQLRHNLAQLSVRDTLNNFLKENLTGQANGRTAINEKLNFDIENQNELILYFASTGRTGMAINASSPEKYSSHEGLYHSYAYRLREVSKHKKRTERTLN